MFRGRTLGGTSAINGMIYMRGLSRDFDDWAMPNWGWVEIENLEGQTPEAPLRITTQAFGIPLCDAVIASVHDSGVPTSDNLNAVDGEVIGYSARNIWRGWRQSSATAFLTPQVRRRPNLRILTDTDVDRLQYDGTRVAGIAAVRNGAVISFQAGREVILCAVALATPKLLMR